MAVDTELQELIFQEVTQEEFNALDKAGQTGLNQFYLTPDLSTRLPIFTSLWVDHKVNDMSWLNADTFSWQSGDVYVAAYEHLVDDIAVSDDGYITTENGVVFNRDSSKDKDGLIAWTSTDSTTIYTSNPPIIGETPSAWDDTRQVWGVYGSTISSGSNVAYQERISDITITFYKAEDGHKICLADQEANVQRLYDATGIAWYYILDTENKQFKLPRTKHAFTGLRDSVGGYVKAGLPNITGTLSVAGDAGITIGGNSGAFTLGDATLSSGPATNTQSGAKRNAAFDASRSSPVYGNSNTVQPEATQMYLYFFVGNYTKSAIEQTAGITSEQLNNKLDKSAETYLVPSGSVTAFAGTTAPTGWLKCDGSAISRTTYAALFAVIGTTYGTGDGSTTFNLPTQSVLPLGTSANVSVFGTGKALGINDGSSNGGMSTKKSDSLGWSMLVLNTNNYNQNIGYAGATTANTTKTAVGVVTDASKSGLKGTVNLANATGAKAIVCIKY